MARVGIVGMAGWVLGWSLPGAPLVAEERSYERLTHASTSVVIATVQSSDVVMQPETRKGPAPQVRQDGTSSVQLSADDGSRGRIVRVVIDEVLKSDGNATAGGVADVYDPAHGIAAPGWIVDVGARYALFLFMPAYSESEKLERKLVARRVPAGSLGEGSLVHLDRAYRLTSNPSGAVPIDGLTVSALEFLRGDVREAARPRVTLTYPTPGAALSGLVTLRARAVDDGGIAAVSFAVDGREIGAELEWRRFGQFEQAWNSQDVADGAHTISARARDGSGDTATVSVDVTVANGRPKP